ncbi:hypothetical protein IVB14_32740 [Bradyrhizobium sp. 180]|uniref:hypothetical protein n=1 Tax=Bradyrhizobium sp. 180 TaxID=2782650 RepID=UPI001FF83F2A|nr:hypothetical protein [Bradyrhizobium sp. 180]MCK1495046.1 hypothetical protein [Bradyrhizobium sp. 180]
MICKSDEAIQTFIAHCEIAARDLLMPYGDILMVVSTVLRIKRTLSGTEIDKIIRDVVAGNATYIERRRREDWRKRELSAASFTK